MTLKKYEDRDIEERLAAIPVFYVVNSGLAPYLAYRKSGIKIFLFLDYADACAYLAELVQTVPEKEADAQVVAMSMAKAYKLARSGPRGTGQADQFGQERTMSYTFSPSSKSKDALAQIKTAEPLATGAVPGFIAEGLTLTRGRSQRINPVFLSYDDLLSAWEEKRAADPATPAKPVVSTIDVMSLCLAIENMDQLPADFAEAVKNYGIVPSSENMEQLDKKRSKGNNNARLHVGM